MEDLNLHFTGDFHAITSANNLLAAMLDNHLQQGNALNIDPNQIVWKRCVDMNDRVLRNIVVGLGRPVDGVVREDHFIITVASEIMAILCLANDMKDLKERLSRIIVAYSYSGEPVTAGQLNAVGSMAALLKDAIKPNVIQTLENTPALVHGGPFANIAHGCNSVVATKTAMALGDYVVTEAGFGGDLGAEKFLDIKCRAAGIEPDAVVIVATVRGLKHHGGVKKQDLTTPDTDALKAGLPNLMRHVHNITEVFGKPAVVAINRFPTDSDDEVETIKKACLEHGVDAVLNDSWKLGGEGAIDLAHKVVELCDKPSKLNFTYDLDDSIQAKLDAIVKKVYGGEKAVLTADAKSQLKRLREMGADKLPICVAKTQYSFSDDPNKLGAPEGFKVTVRNLKVSAGAGFVVALTGDIMTMPGLPKVPSAELIDIDENGTISGLF